MDLDRADKLLALATDASTTEEERRTAAVVLVRLMKDTEFLSHVRELIARIEKLIAFLTLKGIKIK